MLYRAIGHQVLPTPAFNVIPQPSVSYRQGFWPILYFQPSPSQSDLRQFPTQPLPREAEDFPMILDLYLYMYTVEISACGENFDKKRIEQQPH